MNLLHDVLHATRSLARQPGFTTVTVATLALGLGVNIAMFAVAYGVLWRPLPYPEPDRLVTIATRRPSGAAGVVRITELNDWTERFRTTDVAGHETRERSLRGAGPARIVSVATVTANFFEVLGLPAAQGVTPRLTAGDARAVISSRLARVLETSSGGPAIGQAVTIGEEPYEVAAVMPPAFAFPVADA